MTKVINEKAQSILIVDDHPILRRGLIALIESEPDISVFGEAASSQGAIAAIEDAGADNRPDLAIVDLRLEESDGLELIKTIKARFAEISILVISMHDESLYAERALRAGAMGYISKQHLDQTVLTAIRRVLNGERFLSERMLERFTDNFLRGNQAQVSDSPLAVLTDREIEVFGLIGQGYSTRKIAEQLGLSVKTIESHRENIKHKMTLESGALLVQRAVSWVETGVYD